MHVRLSDLGWIRGDDIKPNTSTIVIFWLIGFYDNSTLVGYLMPNPFLHKLSVLFKTIQFIMSAQFNWQKTFLFQAIQFIQTVLFQTIQLSISTQFKCKKQ